MIFLKKHIKKIFIFVILAVLAGLLFYFFVIRQKLDERDTGTFDLGPHPSDVMIRFSRAYKSLKFQDALNFTQKEYDALTKREILKMENKRFDKWINAIENPNAK